MSKKLRIVLAQLNLEVGDIQGNLEKHLHAVAIAQDMLSADAIVFPELSLVGYPAEDLLLRPSFIAETEDALRKFTAEIKHIYCIVGHPYAGSHHLYNACSIIYNKKIIGHYKKQYLPNYGVFDEYRYFTPGNQSCLLSIRGIPVGLMICEDIWRLGPARKTVDHGAKLIIVPNASPFEIDKHDQRIALLNKRAIQHRVPILYVNHISGQDDLVFDGGSLAVNEKGELCQFAGFFNECLFPIDIDTQTLSIEAQRDPIIIPSTEARIYQALVLSVRDYVTKNHFPGVLVGVSGGIDSALTLAIAVDALGKDRVHAVIMPSRFTSDISMEDAKALADHLDVSSEIISIEPSYQCFIDSLAPCFHGKKPDITEENIQARCRAIILMALSNKRGHMVLTTGNRSELAVGYCTLYGDMAGGFAVLKDIPKTRVYQLAIYRNQQKKVIPQRTIDRAPTAELALNQKDEDTLPPYPLLDDILEHYLNKGLSRLDMIAQGFDAHTVDRIINLIHKNEYKRRQAVIGPHIQHQSFGKDWRYPNTHRYKN